MKALIVVLLVFVLLFYGCAGASSQNPPATGQNQNTQSNPQNQSNLQNQVAPPAKNNAPPAPPSDNGTVQKKPGIVADNKTGYEKTQQTITQVIADGTYVKEIQYPYHSGNTTVDVKVTVKNDTVTSVSVAGVNADKISMKIIGNFAAALPDLVVGKKISDIKLPRNVAGSSLTSAVFQQYVNSLVQNHGQGP